MSDPILELSNPAHWEFVYNETFRAGALPGNRYIPLQPVDIPVLVSSPLLVIEAENLDAKPWWFLGCRIQQRFSVGIAPDTALGAFVRVPVNRPRLFRFPRLSADYSLRAEIPPWYDRMKIVIYEYTGPIGDTTERAVIEQGDLIRVDLTRIETKIDNL